MARTLIARQTFRSLHFESVYFRSFYVERSRLNCTGGNFHSSRNTTPQHTRHVTLAGVDRFSVVENVYQKYDIWA